MPIKFERTHNTVLIKLVCRHPDVYPYIGEDGLPAPDEFEPQADPRAWWVVAKDGAEILGLFLFLPRGLVCWECHVCLLPTGRKRGIRAGRGVIGWFWQHTGGRRLIASISVTNPQAIRYAQACGLRVIGRNEKSFLKNGQLHDQVLLGLSPEDK